MRRSTLWIPAHRQPPVLLLAAVILASLCPLAVQLLIGPELSVARASMPEVLPIERPDADFASVAKLAAALPIPDATEEPTEILIIEDEPEAQPTPRQAVPARTRVAKAKPTPRPKKSAVGRALAACKNKNKDAAKSAYKRLPLGDNRRKQIRKGCRERGVLIL